jgi:excisionase family DNA binding protein
VRSSPGKTRRSYVGAAKVGRTQSVEKSGILGEAFRAELKQIVEEAVCEALAKMQAIISTELLTPEQLSARLQVPVSWVYEQSRHDKIPTHRIGRYIRFELREVLQYLADAATIDCSIRKAG